MNYVKYMAFQMVVLQQTARVYREQVGVRGGVKWDFKGRHAEERFNFH
jgi:hypothetical protein